MNSCVSVGYDGRFDFQRRSTPDQSWAVKHQSTNRQLNFREAAAEAAALIHSRLRNPAVLLSGGVDSEVCVRAFLDAGIKVPALIFQLTPTPTLDVQTALETASLLQLPARVIRLQLADEQLQRVGRQGACPSPQLATHCLMLDAADNLGYSPILATGDNELCRVDGTLALLEREKEFSVHRYLRSTAFVNAVPAFFQVTPELVLSRFTGPGLDVWRRLRGDYEAAKLAFYQVYYPDLRPRNKLHGFEELGWEETDIVKLFWVVGLFLAMIGIIYGVWL